MTAAALPQRRTPRGGGAGLPLVFALALREMRNGLRGFYVFIACVALGVAAITAVAALADALRSSFEAQGEALLGGDVTLSRPHKSADEKERAWLAAQGAVSETGMPQPIEMKGQGIGRNTERLCHLACRHPFGARLYQQAEDIEPIVLSERCQRADGICLFHISANIEMTRWSQHRLPEEGRWLLRVSEKQRTKPEVLWFPGLRDGSRLYPPPSPMIV